LDDKPEDHPENVEACLALCDDLERLLDKYPKLVLGEGEMPDPTKFYKGQTFTFGLPEDKRSKKRTEYGETYPRIVVPMNMQRQIVENIHVQTGHAGVFETYQTLRQYHWFRGMKVMIKDAVRHCPDCIGSKGKRLTKATLAPDERPLELGGRWHIDGLYMSVSEDFDHLMVVVDVATKYIILRASKGEASDAASAFVMEIVRRFGRPKEITSDKGRAFINELFRETCKNLFIQFKPIAVGRPQADGMVERVNRTITDAASMLLKGDPAKWADHVGEIEYIMNTRVSSVTKFSPYGL